MAGLDPATQPLRVCAAKRLFRRADARHWVAASRAAMVILGESLVKFKPSDATGP
jgi:hypothetical protein